MGTIGIGIAGAPGSGYTALAEQADQVVEVVVGIPVVLKGREK